MNYKNLELSSWNRVKQYEFFKKYENPFFNICSKLDVTELLNHCRQHKLSFSTCMLFASIDAANKFDEFKYRLKGDGVVVYDSIYAGSTVLSDDDVFNFCYYDYFTDFTKFYENARVQNTLGKSCKLDFDGRNNDLDIIHYSVIPWIEFTSITHPRTYNTSDSIPKIVFGKYYEENGRCFMPISLEVHHALMDGYHLGKYLQLLQKSLTNPIFIC